MRTRLLIISFLTLYSGLFAQVTLQHRIGIGHNPTTKTYADISTNALYSLPNWHFQAGVNWQGSSYLGTSLQALTLGAGYNIPISQPLSAELCYMYHPHTRSLISEQTVALSLLYLPSHFDIQIGTYVRFLQSQQIGNETVTESKLFLYQLNAYVMPKNNIYNAMLGVRSYDTFDIEQAGNPIYVLQLSYRPKVMQYFIEGCVKPAGFYNILVHPFHTQLRGGIVWTP